MAEADDTKGQSEIRPSERKDSGRKDTRRNLNANIAQRQKLLLAGIGGVTLLAGAIKIGNWNCRIYLSRVCSAAPDVHCCVCF